MKYAVFLLMGIEVYGQRILRLEDVLQSVERSYPPLLAAAQDIEIAEADLVSALGRFDTTLRFRLDSDQFGFYDNDRVDFGVEQPTQFMGSSFFTGWRRGEGNFAAYDGKLETRSLGEFRAGLRVPLFRDRAIDSRRADLRKSELGRSVAKLSVDQQKIVILQLATRRYWDWVAAGRRLQLAESLLNLASTRDKILREAVQLGQLPAIEVTDNERAILQRRSQVVEGERGLQQAAIELSLFYRDDNGRPLIAEASLLPPAFPALGNIESERIQQDIDTALRRRPELQRLIVQRQQTEVDRQLAGNQKLPGIDFVASFTQEGGTGIVKRGPQELKAALVFDLPFQRRSAIGRERSADAKITQFRQRETFARDQIVAEVRDAASAVQAAYRRSQVLADEVRVARELEGLERSRFELGDSNLFFVNLREQSTFDASLRELGAQADYFRAFAAYELAIADALTRRP